MKNSKKNEEGERERDYLQRCGRSTGKREREGRWPDGGERGRERERAVENTKKKKEEGKEERLLVGFKIGPNDRSFVAQKKTKAHLSNDKSFAPKACAQTTEFTRERQLPL